MPASSLNVNVACLACDGTRPCADCRAVGKALAAAGHRVHHSSRYAALRAAADGTYGFSACIVPVRAGERSISDSIVALLADARVAIAAEDPTAMPSPLPANVTVFPRSDYLAGKIPKGWPDDSKAQSSKPSAARPNAKTSPRASAPSAGGSVRSDATRRLRALPRPVTAQPADATALLNDELAWYRASSIGFALLAFSFTGESAEATAAALSPLLRAGDAVSITERRCIAILAGADGAHAKRVAARAEAGLRKRLGAARTKALTGIAVCPLDGTTANALLARAHAQLRDR